MLIEDPVDLRDQRIMEFGLYRIKGNITFPVVVMICTRCGFIRQHSVDHILKSGYQS